MLKNRGWLPMLEVPMYFQTSTNGSLASLKTAEPPQPRTYIPRTRLDRVDGARQFTVVRYEQRQPTRSIDPVTQSEAARSLAAARAAVRNAPDVCDEKVAEFKQRLSDGSYNVPARLLARKLLDG